MRPALSQNASLREDRELLVLDGGAGLFELSLELVGLVLLDALLDSLGCAVDEILGLLQAQAGGGTDDLDDLDLLVAGAGDDHVNGRRLILASGVATTGTAGSGGRSGSGNGSSG